MDYEEVQGHSAWQFFLRRIVIVLVVLLICALAFFWAMQYSSCAVLADEAMTARINYALSLKDVSKDTLSGYFTESFIQSGKLDELKSIFDPYTITNYNESASTQKVRTFPGGSRATVRIHEKVAGITGEVKSKGDTPSSKLPDWENGLYSVKLRKVDGKWLIADIEMIKPDPKELETVETTPGATTTE